MFLYAADRLITTDTDKTQKSLEMTKNVKSEADENARWRRFIKRFHPNGTEVLTFLGRRSYYQC